MMLKPDTGRYFITTENSLHQRYLGTNMVVIKRVDCMFFALFSFWIHSTINEVLNSYVCSSLLPRYLIDYNRVMSVKFGHQVNSDIHLQTVEIHMRRLLMSRLIRIFTVYLVNLFFIPIIKICNKHGPLSEFS